MKEKLYIQMFSIHGLLRAENMEMGRDADTGGQIKYVVELCEALSKHEKVDRVDLFTRLIADKSVSDDYSQIVEEVNSNFRIVRIQCGGKKYMRKELLWPHLDEYVDKMTKFIKKEGTVPDLVHGHYADAGYVASQLSEFFGIPFVFTGHSLGRVKKQKLLTEGFNEVDIVKKYKIDQRIDAEEYVLKAADIIITSTKQEVEHQYGMYECGSLPAFCVIPPGLDLEIFYPYYHDDLIETNRKEEQVFAQASILAKLNRFFLQPDKPIVLALCRPDKKKNISGLIRAYGEDKELQSMANLAIFAGIRKDISDKEENEKEVLTEMLLLMDKYDLYGKMAIPKKHDFEYEVPELYRIAAEKKGVFVNVALTEPFGLTLLEAAAVGLPIIATDDGGPRDIIKNCACGILVNPVKTGDISNAMKKIISNSNLWKRFSKNGIMKVRKRYTWESHVRTYLKEIIALKKSQKANDISMAKPSDPIGKRIIKLNYFLITDIDNTLIGQNNEQLNHLLTLLKNNSDKIGFGVATGRTVESAVRHLKEHNVDHPADVIISSVGSELYYGEALLISRSWRTHIARQWDRDKIKKILDTLDFLEYQEEDTQREFKISYNMEPAKDRIALIHELLIKNKCRYNLVYSHNKFLDILPYRASKGKAIRFFSYKWEIPTENFLVCGDSGNDEEMLRGGHLAVVVGNHSAEIEKLRGRKNIYFADATCAGGIVEALKHYNFFTNKE